MQVRRNVLSSPKFHVDESAAMKPPYIIKRNIFANKRAKETRPQQNITSEWRMYLLAKARQFADSEIIKHRIT